MDDGDNPSFPPTTWSMVLGAAGPNGTCNQAALTAFCETYHEPVLRFVRRLGIAPHQAEDVTQQFFLRLISENLLGRVDRERTRKFRSFLTTVISNFVKDQYRRERSRGAEVTCSVEASAAVGRPIPELSDDLTPDRLFQRDWAMHTLAQAMRELDERNSRRANAERYRELRPFLQVDRVAESDYARIAAKLHISPESLPPPMSRLREELALVLTDVVGRTMANPTRAEILAELRELLGYIRGDRR